MVLVKFLMTRPPQRQRLRLRLVTVKVEDKEIRVFKQVSCDLKKSPKDSQMSMETRLMKAG